MSLPLVAIVGRPNVGKSTLLNRLISSQFAIVDSVAGITRDRNYVKSDWNGKFFTIVDTGGLDFTEDAEITKQITKQAMLAVEEADLILFVVDNKSGLLDTDKEIANILRKSGKITLLVVNKVDSQKESLEKYSFFQLGIGEPIEISALHGQGIGELLDQITSLLPEIPPVIEEEDFYKIAIIGGPNAGKSSLFNKLLGEERAIVSAVPGTTRDAIDTIIEKNNKKYCFIDTAGFKKKSKTESGVEYYSMIRTLKAIDRCHIAILVIDATTGVTSKDQKIADYAESRGCASLIAINKWDLIEKETSTAKEYIEKTKRDLRFLDYSPVITISALTGQRVNRLFPVIDNIAEEYFKKISTNELNKLVKDLKAAGYTISKGRLKLKISYAAQIKTAPPAFLFFVNHPQLVNSTYKNYLKNRIREAFDFTGCPLELYFRKEK
ncbi:MAG: ribosome biogenesis GTPase Der [Actinobacteria bacterium]|nr:ribosome biogenesis GTPase Der [Actinomycetota bacterium]